MLIMQNPECFDIKIRRKLLGHNQIRLDVIYRVRYEKNLSTLVSLYIYCQYKNSSDDNKISGSLILSSSYIEGVASWTNTKIRKISTDNQ